MAEFQKHYQTCVLCEARCGVVIEHDGQTVKSIRGDQDDPFSQGYICPKAVALQDLHEDPDRLRKPVKKVAGGWQEISWNEALDTVAEKLKGVQQRYGNNALGTYVGNPNVHNLGNMLMLRNLLQALPTHNRFSATSVDQLPHHIVSYHLFGHQLRIPVPDIDRTDHMLILGGNPMASNGSIMTVPNVKKRLKRIEQAGGKLVVIDPRRSETADIATEHHFIKPGTDAALLLGMVNYLFENDLFVDGRVSQLVKKGAVDWKTLAEHVKPYSIERVAQVTGIAGDELKQTFDDFCAAEKPVIYGRMGVSVQQFGLLCQYLIMVINIMRGRLDEAGGMMFTTPAIDTAAQLGRGSFAKRRSRVRGLPEFSGEFPSSTLIDELETPGEGQIKAMLLVAGNPVLSTPNGAGLDKALAKLDYMVAIDMYVNETNRHADIILPPVSPLERDHYDLIFNTFAVRNNAKYSAALFEKPNDSKHDWQIFLALEKRLKPKPGIGERVLRTASAKGGPKLLLRLLWEQGPYGLRSKQRVPFSTMMKAHHGLDLGPLQSSLPNILGTRSKQIELNVDFYMGDLARVEAQLFADENNAAPDMQSAVLIGRRHLRSNNSWLHNSHRLVKGKSRCTMMIHPDHAAELMIQDGDLVAITSRVGSIEIAAQLTDELMPGVISIPHGWGHTRQGTGWTTAEKHAGVSVNDLTDGQLIDELSGNAAVNGVKVTLTKVAAPQVAAAVE